MTNSNQWQEMGDPGPLKEVNELKVFLERRVKGQQKAINSLCKIYQYELTLRWLEDRRGPVGVLMFLGPSGVGKTELARVLAEYFMGSIDSLVKVDCSAFSQPHMIHSLIGSPHGYVGYNEEPTLSEAKLKGKFKNKKLPKPTKLPAENLLSQQRENKINEIHFLNFRLKSLENDFKARKGFLKGIKQHHQIMHGSINGEESVAEILKDERTRFEISEMLNPEAGQMLINDLENPAEDAAMLLGISLELKQIYSAHKEVEIRKERVLSELRKINEEIYASKNIKPDPEDQKDDSKGDKEPEQRLVLLFDEIEKANTTLHQLLLQVMEDGRITLANGSTTDLRNAFIILTSNVGSASIGDILKEKGIGFGSSYTKTRKDSKRDVFQEVEKNILSIAEREMGKVFRPEFRRRIDEVVVFHPLSPKTFHEILDYQIELFTESLNVVGVDLVVEQNVKDLIVEQSLHRPEVGASLLDHKFKSLVKIPLGQRLSSREIKGTILVFVDENRKVKFSLGD